MNAIKQNIPNFITCLNLLSGVVGIALVASSGLNNLEFELHLACYCVFAAAIFDFLDGLIARLLKVQSKIGKDLDSLADVVSFGVLPSMILFNIMVTLSNENLGGHGYEYINLLTFMVPVFAAVRLARFNNDPEQSYNFKGLPVPAAGLVITSLCLYILYFGEVYFDFVGAKAENVYSLPRYDRFFPKLYTSPIFLGTLPVLVSALMVSKLKLIAFKLNNFSFKKYIWHVILLILCIISAIVCGFASAPIILILYIIISQIHFRTKRHEI